MSGCACCLPPRVCLQQLQIEDRCLHIILIGCHGCHLCHCIQGMLIKRHQPKKSATESFGPADFVVGDSFTLYSRTYHIVDADAFTRAYMAATHGLQLADAVRLTSPCTY